MARVIQGYFTSGIHPVPAQRNGTPPAQTGPLTSRPSPPRPAYGQGATATMLQRSGGDGSFAVDPVQVGLVQNGGKPLPQALLAKMEAAFQADFSAVRIHVGPQASRIGAIAFTTGNDLYFAPGQYQPDSLRGQQLIGHELAHVIQQRQGRVRASGNGVAVVQDRQLEAEADRLGMKAASALLAPTPTVAGSRIAVQRKPLGTAIQCRARDSFGGRARTIQRLTQITFNAGANRPGTDMISAIYHTRVPHNATQTTLAVALSGYKPGTTGLGTCRHYIAYDMVKNAVLGNVRGKTVDAARNWLHGLNANMPKGEAFKKMDGYGQDCSVGDIPDVDIPVIVAAAGLAPAQYRDNDIELEIEDLIANLANDPRNLYYWPRNRGDAAGTRLDWPIGEDGDSRLYRKDVVERLGAYRQQLATMGLTF